jgi:hypothetical protein
VPTASLTEMLLRSVVPLDPPSTLRPAAELPTEVLDTTVAFADAETSMPWSPLS